ncbi:MAG: amidohydrolase family protein [Bryobacteraceae bacterium]
MAQLVLLRGAKQVLTLRGSSGARRGAALNDLGIIEDGSVLIRDGVIAGVGPTRRLENLKEARTALEIPANGGVVIPGFVDANIHVSPGPAKRPGARLHTRKQMAEFHDESLALMRACLEHGTLTAEVKANSDTGDAASDIAALRQLAAIGDNPVRMLRSWRVNAVVSESALTETVTALVNRGLAHFMDLTAESELPDRRDLGLNLVWHGGDCARLGDLISRVNPQTISCHSHISSDECSVLSKTSSVIVLSPGREVLENDVGGSVAQLAASGAAIALSSGYDSRRSPTFNMQMVLSLAVLRLRLTAEQAIIASTINGAHAAGCAHLVGSLELGKRADIIVLHVPDYREIAGRFGVNHVGMALRDGNIVLNRTRRKVSAH